MMISSLLVSAVLVSPASAAPAIKGVKKAVLCGVYGPAAISVGKKRGGEKDEALGFESQGVLDSAYDEFVSQAKAAGYEFASPAETAQVAKALKAQTVAKGKEANENLAAGRQKGAQAAQGGVGIANEAAIKAIRDNPQIPAETKKMLLAQYGAQPSAPAPAGPPAGVPDYAKMAEARSDERYGGKDSVSSQSQRIANYCPTTEQDSEGPFQAELRKIGADGWITVHADVGAVTKLDGNTKEQVMFQPRVYAVSGKLLLDGTANGKWGLNAPSGATLGSARKAIEEKVPEAVGVVIGKLVK